jgi:hypothetical protein
MKQLQIYVFVTLLILAGCAAEEPVKYSDDEGLSKSGNFPSTILLPDGFEPEGIVTGLGTTFYVGSLTSGAIYKGDYRTGEGSILVPASSRLAVGLSYDARSDYLYVAGGETGALYIYDGSSGELIAEYNITGAILLNDVVVTKEAAFLTESYGPVIYKLPLEAAGTPLGPVEEMMLTGDYQYIPNAPSPFGINNNGIAATENGKYLIIGSMANGSLYKVNAETGYASLIDLGGLSIEFNDGLVLINHTLYVVQNILNTIVEIKLSPDLLSGSVVNVITDPAFEVPATIALFGRYLYAVNARFTLPPGPFNVVKVIR